MDCDRIMKEEITEKYLLGRLSETEQESFEEHFFECSRCFAEVETYRALQAELKQAAPAIRAEPAIRPHSFWRWAWAPAAALALLVVGVGWWLRRPAPAPVQPPSPVAQKSAPQPAPPAPGPSLTELAQVQPPNYTPAILRGAEDEATQRFRAAMRHYVKGDYAAAIPGLRTASKLNPQASDMNFFLGICYLMTDETDAAIERLRRTVALGDSPYLEDTHFYLAKCYLRKNDLPAARNELENTVQLQGEHEGESRGLLKQVERVSGPRP